MKKIYFKVKAQDWNRTYWFMLIETKKTPQLNAGIFIIRFLFDGYQFIRNDNLEQSPSSEWRAVGRITVHHSTIWICRMGSDIHDISLVDLHHHDSCDVSHGSSAFCTTAESANWIRINNNLGEKITLTIQCPGEHVNTLTRRSEYSGMTIVVPANIGNHVIKYKCLVMSNGDFVMWHVRIESHAPWTYKFIKIIQISRHYYNVLCSTA